MWNRTVPVTDPDTVGELKDRALSRRPLRDLAPETYMDILQSLEIDRGKLSDEAGNIDELTKYAMAEAHVMAYKDAAQQAFVYREMQQDYQADAEAVDADTQQFDVETRQLVEEMKARHDEQRDQLNEDQEEAMLCHLDMWKSERTMRKYSHASLDLIVKRQQFDLYMKQRDYQNAKACAAEIQSMEELEALRATDAIKTDYRESLRRLRFRQRDEVVAFETKAKDEREQLFIRRRRSRQVLLNVKKKLNSKEQTFREASKAWALTRGARMNSISKTIPADEPLSPTPPSTPGREVVRSHGRFQRQSERIKLPPLEFSKF
jgi:hypothetical protein